MYEIAYLRGGQEDDSGPEMADAAMAVLSTLLSSDCAPDIKFVPVEGGTHCHRLYESSLPPATIRTVRRLGIVFKAPTSCGKYPQHEGASKRLRRALGTYANINEFRSYHGVPTAVHPNIDLVLVRENTEGLAGRHRSMASRDAYTDVRRITRLASERVARVAFELACQRRQSLTVCAFSMAIEGDRFFIEVCERVGASYPDVEMSVRSVDTFAGTAVTQPDRYDVVVAPNDWGAIMTDLLGGVCGSVGLCARANTGDNTALFEPIHGTAPGKAGKGTVNPISQIMSAKLMLKWLGDRFQDRSAIRAATLLEQAVTEAIANPRFHTPDLGGTATTRSLVDAISENIRHIASYTAPAVSKQGEKDE